MNLVITLPTRGRPERLISTIERTLPLIALPTTRLVIAADDDDEPTISALESLPKDERLVTIVAPREDALGEKYNRCLVIPADVYINMADYTAWLTPDFDARVLGAAALFPDGIGVVFSHMANASFPSCQGVTRRLVDKLGWMYPPYFPFWFVDHWIDDIAKLIDRISFADVQVDAGPAKLPTQELRDVEFWATFFDMMRLFRRKQARDIILGEDFLEPEWRKEILLRHYPLIEFRSQSINDIVRQAGLSSAPGGGERAERLKVKALRMMAEWWPQLKDELNITITEAIAA